MFKRLTSVAFNILGLSILMLRYSRQKPVGWLVLLIKAHSLAFSGSTGPRRSFESVENTQKSNLFLSRNMPDEEKTVEYNKYKPRSLLLLS